MNASGPMPHHRAGVAEGRFRIRGAVRAVARKLSDRIHAAEDARARALGWEITEIPGWLGLHGRSYRDPRFDARRQALQDAQAR
jgi:hypothetical protein